jgi:hypothetical protein
VAALTGDCSQYDGSPVPVPGDSFAVAIPAVGPGDTVEVCFVQIAVGSVVLVTNETHGTDAPETWHYTTTSPPLGNPVLVTAANPLPEAAPASDLRTFALVPAGEYAISQLQGRAACQPGATAADFQTMASTKVGSPPTDAETSGVVGPGAAPFDVEKAETTYIRFDNVGCGTVLETGLISIEVVNDLDGDGSRDPGEPGIPGRPLEISGPDGTVNMLTDAAGMAYYTVVTGGTYAVRQGIVPGWLATAPVEADVSAGLGETRQVTFFNQPRVVVSAAMTEISMGSPGGAPGEGWTFELSGCGETRTLVSGAAGDVTFTDLPPAAGCEYTVGVGDRAGWATIDRSKTAGPVGPGEEALLAFVSVKIDVCLDCASPAAIAGDEPRASVPVLEILPGANLVAWPGGPVLVEDVFGDADGVVAVYLWDAAAGSWLKYFPGLPGYLNNLQVLEPGAAYWVIARQASGIRVVP